VLLEVQSGFRTKLTGDSTLMAIITGVFDEAPNIQPYPFISFGEKVKVPWSTFQKASWEVAIMLDIWAALDSGDTAMTVLAEVDRILHYQKLTMTSYDNALTENENTVTQEDETNQVRHVAIRFRTLNSLI